ncbi:unnamed protein product [Rotaria sp. Silwood1]|nr:unnamed protein product [Rotaria sp. Silwood1]
MLDPLVVGATVVMVPPYSQMDINTVASTIHKHTVTFALFTPTYTVALQQYCESSSTKESPLLTLQLICNGGEQNLMKMMFKVVLFLRSYFAHTIGYDCQVLDDYLQPIVVGDIGELHIAGKGVFAGYLNREDLTKKALIEYKNNTYYKTGDLVKIDEHGLIHFIGRKDFQVKLRGQRIEIGEIEQIILNFSSQVTHCVVIKYKDHLIAYVESSTTEVIEDKLKEHCEKHLPQYMIPSLFIIMKKFPVNANGKLDRHRLPEPDFTKIASSDQLHVEPHDQLEIDIHNIWCELLGLKKISVLANLFSIGGNSLVLMKLFSQYQIKYNYTQSIALLFQQSTIRKHSQLLQSTNTSQQQFKRWTPLHINEGQSSYAQERIWLDEQMRFNSVNSQIAIYNIPFLYRLTHGQLSIERLQQTLTLLIKKHSILRTSLIYDQEKQYLKQIINETYNYSFEETIISNDDQLQDIIKYEETSNKIFDLTNGKVFRCHLIRQERNDKGNILNENDFILFNIHHSAFDGTSIEIFINDFEFAYTNGQLTIENELTYLDYSKYERQMDMTQTRQYWSQLLEGYDREKQLRLPYEYHIETSQRSGHGGHIDIQLDSDLIHRMSLYANQLNISMFQLCLSCYYVYLFKLTHDQDLCIGSVNSNRYRHELQPIMGMFVNLLPYRIKLDVRKTSFDDLVKYIQHLSSEILSNGHLPYQEIIQLHKDTNEISSSLLPYVQTMLQYDQQESSNNHQIHLDNDQTCLSRLTLSSSSTTKFDLTLNIFYRSELSMKQLDCSFDYSLDLFKEKTIEIMTKRFEKLLIELFQSSFNKSKQPLYELSLILPYEQKIFNDLNQTNVNFDYPIKCIHHEFIQRSEEYSQKVSIILDEQSLTYSELFYYVQLVSIHLIKNFNVKLQEIICQCVERSLEMVIGILSILMTGGIYCPLNPQDPEMRLLTLLHDTQAKHLLLHRMTKEKFNFKENIIENLINIDEIILENNFIDNEHCLSNVNVNKDDIAYLIFTSGSTGKPKGVSFFWFFVCK